MLFASLWNRNRINRLWRGVNSNGCKHRRRTWITDDCERRTEWKWSKPLIPALVKFWTGDEEKNYGFFFGTFHISTHKRLFGVVFLRIGCRQKHTVLLISSYEWNCILFNVENNRIYGVRKDILVPYKQTTGLYHDLISQFCNFIVDEINFTSECLLYAWPTRKYFVVAINIFPQDKCPLAVCSNGKHKLLQVIPWHIRYRLGLR